jgi:putative spermidine/putrescine transport system permease protein
MNRSRYSIGPLLFAAAMLVCLFLLAPLVIVIVTSFSSVSYNSFPQPGLSLQWYHHLGSQPQFLKAFINSILLSGGATLLALVVGTLAALAVQRFSFPGRSFLRSFFMSPMVVPKIALGVAYLILFSRMKIAGGIPSLILGEAVTVMPFVFSILGSTLANVKRVHEEAAADLGAGPLRVFFTVTLPQMRMGLLLSGTISFIFTFDQVETALLVLRPKSYTLPIELFLYMEKWQDPTIAVISTILIVLALAGFFGLKLLLRSAPEVSKFFNKNE